MATEDINIIDPDSGAGYNYDSLYDWEAAEQADLPTADIIAIAKCRCTGGTADTGGACDLTGWTTDATRYIKIWTDPAESYRHGGTFPTGNKYRISTDSNISLLIIRESYVRIDGLAIHHSPLGSDQYWCIKVIEQDFGSSDIRISNCVARGDATSRGFFGNDDSAGLTNLTANLWNNIAYDFSGNNWGVYYCSANGSGDVCTYYLYNCIGYKSSLNRGVRSYQATGATNSVTAINCGMFGMRADVAFLGTFTAGSNYNASDDTTSPGANSLDSLDEATEFVNLTAGSEDLHLKSTSNLINAGVSDPGSGLFSNDIDGQTRSGSWDIGADEYVSAGEEVAGIFQLGPAALARLARQYRTLGGGF